jgi:cAMP phosphodiesterase
LAAAFGGSISGLNVVITHIKPTVNAHWDNVASVIEEQLGQLNTLGVHFIIAKPGVDLI